MTQEEYDSYALDENSPSFLQEGAVVFNDPSWNDNYHGNAGLSLFEVNHGELKGYQNIGTEVAKYQSQLDGLARAVAYAVNTIHADNGDPDGHSPVSFFVGEEVHPICSINAGNIRVNQAIFDDMDNINTGRAWDSPEGNGERPWPLHGLGMPGCQYRNL